MHPLLPHTQRISWHSICRYMENLEALTVSDRRLVEITFAGTNNARTWTGSPELWTLHACVAQIEAVCAALKLSRCRAFALRSMHDMERCYDLYTGTTAACWQWRFAQSDICHGIIWPSVLVHATTYCTHCLAMNYCAEICD